MGGIDGPSRRGFIFMQAKDELWRPVLLLEEYYDVSNLGNVRSKDRTIDRGDGDGSWKKRNVYSEPIKPFKNIHGYHMVSLKKTVNRGKNINVHRLVAEAFIPNPENKPCVNHKNGIKTDNRVENLEWVTRSENTIHAIKTGLSSSIGDSHYNSKLTEKKVIDILTSKDTPNELSVKYGVKLSTIYKVLLRKNWAWVKI